VVSEDPAFLSGDEEVVADEAPDAGEEMRHHAELEDEAEHVDEQFYLFVVHEVLQSFHDELFEVRKVHVVLEELEVSQKYQIGIED